MWPACNALPAKRTKEHSYMYIAVISLKWNENNCEHIAEQVGISLYCSMETFCPEKCDYKFWYTTW